jgi:hypothetical protein
MHRNTHYSNIIAMLIKALISCDFLVAHFYTTFHAHGDRDLLDFPTNQKTATTTATRATVSGKVRWRSSLKIMP